MPEAKRALHKKVVVRPRVASPDETPAIEAEGLTRQFGDFVAVDHVSFKIARGEIFGFLGSNGCGKSTTMKMLTGFLPATSGWCKLFGQPDGLERHGGAAQRRLHDAGLLALRRADGRAESRTARAALSPAAREDRATDRRAARALRSEGRRQRAAGQPAARHQAEASARRRGAARALHSHPRRADVGRRPDRARRVLAHAHRSFARRWRDDFRHHPFHERGGTLRPHLAHACGQGAGGRRAAGIGQGARRRFARGHVHRLSRGSGRNRPVKNGRGHRAGGRNGRDGSRSRRRSTSISGDSGPTLAAKRSSCCATRSDWPSPSSARSF